MYATKDFLVQTLQKSKRKMIPVLCSRDAGVQTFFRGTLKAMWGISTQPGDVGRERRGWREKFTGPSLEAGHLTSAHSRMPHVITARNSGKDGPPGKRK